MNIFYNIWGITNDFGYKASILKSKNFNESILSSLNESFSDKNRNIALDFAAANPTQKHFFSIEKKSNYILYTIYRTNWYRGARLSYDAATIISGSGDIENPIVALKSLMNAYVKMKENKIKSMSFDYILSSIKINQSVSPVKSNIKSGYIKYTNETDLIKVFKNRVDTLKNFNKVYFFTNLPYLETGENSVQNLNDYKQISVSFTNYDPSYHSIKLNDQNQSLSFGQTTLRCFPDDEIKIFNGRSNIANSVYRPKNSISVPLSPKPVSTAPPPGGGNRRKPLKNHKYKKIIISINIFLVVIVSGFIIWDKFKEKGSGPHEPETVEQKCELVFKDKQYFNFPINPDGKLK